MSMVNAFRIACVIAFIFYFPAHGFGAEAKGNGKEAVKERLKDKYKVERIELREERGGAIRVLSMNGDFTPPGLEKRGDKVEDLRAVAQAFLTEERELLGLSNSNIEAREHSVTKTGKGFDYRIYIYGLRLEGNRIKLSFVGDKLAYVYADLDTITPEMLNAARRFEKEGITEDDVRRIVGEEIDYGLGSLKIDLSKVHPEKMKEYKNVRVEGKRLTVKEPYVVWEATGLSTRFTIDGLSGKVIKRESTFIQDFPKR